MGWFQQGVVSRTRKGLVAEPRRHTAKGVIAVGIAGVLALQGCGSSSSSQSKSAPSGGTTSSAGSSSCSGAPIKLVTFFSLSGELGVFGNDVPNAAAVAEKAVNGTCAGGRPLQVTVCDDQSTANGSVQCGETAKSNGTLAIIGLTTGPGGSDQGAETANMPALFTVDQTAWDNSSKLSYPDFFPLLAVAGQVRLAKALGKSSFTLAAVDVPPAHVQAQIASGTAQSAGIAFKQIYFPLDTSDFSSVAAQVVSSKTGAIDFLLPEPEQFVRALASAGADFQQTKIISDEGILTPQQQKALASTLEGSYQVGGLIPASATNNAGIDQMKAEYAAAGQAFSPLLSVWAVQEWSAVHLMGTVLGSLSKSAVASLTSQSLVNAVVAHGQYSFPTEGPFNFQSQPFPASSPLAGGRIFSADQQVFELQNGESVPVGPFQSVAGNFSANG